MNQRKPKITLSPAEAEIKRLERQISNMVYRCNEIRSRAERECAPLAKKIARERMIVDALKKG